MNKGAAAMLRDAEDKLARDCRDYAAAIGVTPEPCTTRKPTPAEALEMGIKLPWAGKVQAVSTDTLTKELFLALENYGLTRGEIAGLFSTYQGKVVSLCESWGVPKGKPCVQNKAARLANMEKPQGFKRSGKPGQSKHQAIDSEADLDAELVKVSRELAAAGYDLAGDDDGDPDPAPAVKPLRSHDVIVTNVDGKAVLAQVVGSGSSARLEPVAQATREQVEEFFCEAAPPATGGFVSNEAMAEIAAKLGGSPAGRVINVTVQNVGTEPVPLIDGADEICETCRYQENLSSEEPCISCNGVNLSVASSRWEPMPTPPPSGLSVDQHHYNAAGDFQPIEVMQASMPPEQFIGFLRGNVIKYTMRAGRKDDMRREIDKVIQYATWWRAAVDGKIIDPREG